MYARVTTVTGAPANVDAGIDNFRANVAPFVREAGRGSILLVDRSTGKAISITLWPDEAALAASEERANALRAQATDEMAAGAPTVERFEVAALDV